MKKQRLIFSAGTNPALETISKSKIAKQTVLQLKTALMKQVRFVAKEDNLYQITGLAKVEDAILQQLSIVLQSKSIKGLVDIFPLLSFASSVGGDIALKNSGIKAVFEIKDQRLIAQLQDAESFMIDSVDKTTRDWLAQNISQGLSDGLSVQEIGQKITNEFAEIVSSRAELIVHAESANAASLTEQMAYQENGIGRWFWITSGDDRVTPECSENESVGAIPIGDPFPQGPNNIRPPRFPRCRCHTEPDLSSQGFKPLWTG